MTNREGGGIKGNGAKMGKFSRGLLGVIRKLSLERGGGKILHLGRIWGRQGVESLTKKKGGIYRPSVLIALVGYWGELGGHNTSGC